MMRQVTLPNTLYWTASLADEHHGPLRIAERVRFATIRKWVVVTTSPTLTGTFYAVLTKASTLLLAVITPSTWPACCSYCSYTIFNARAALSLRRFICAPVLMRHLTACL